MKLCYLLTIFQSDAISAHRQNSLVSDKHVPACRFQSVSPDSGALGVVCMQPGVKVNGAYYCDVLLLKQLLRNICQAAGDFYFPVYHVCETASYQDARLQTLHQTCGLQQPRPQFCRLQNMDSHSGMYLSETAREV